VVTIVGRELAVTGLRGIASAGGQIVGASGLGKLKTVAQNIAVGALLFNYETLGLDAHVVGWCSCSPRPPSRSLQAIAISPITSAGSRAAGR
jgi:phosphatidylglycerophosphate synthase